MGAFKDHFSAGSGAYAAHRPTYPDILVDVLAEAAPDQDLALDCGCGSGQLSVPLARRFARVIGTDASASQIAAAQPHPRVEYRVAPAEASGLPDGCASLVVVAQAAHWFDLPAFYGEVRRVAKPGAALALVSYGVLEIAEPAVAAPFNRFYHEEIGRFWPPERRHVEERYRGLPFPFPELPAPDLAIEVSWNLDDLLAYVGTWSAVALARRELGPSPLEDLERRLAAAWGDRTVALPMRFPLTLRLGRVG